MEFFIGNLKVIDTRKDDKGNIYHFTMTRSLLLTVICEIGIKETSYKDKYYLNYVSIHWNADLKTKIDEKHFEYKPLDFELIKKTANELLLKYLLDKHKEQSNKMSEGEIVAFCNGLIDGIFDTDQKEVDNKINLIY